IDQVWSGHYVGFDVLVDEGQIYIGYYDANRQLTVASRPEAGSRWIYHKLQSWLGWDSHNSIALAIDRAGHLHVAANMHRDPLNYFRTTQPGDIRSLSRVKEMVSEAREQEI